MDIKDEIRRNFEYLFNKWSFSFIDTNDYAGNMAIAEADDILIRFIHDRNDFFLDIGNKTKPNKWIEFYKILDQLSASGRINLGYKYSNKMKVVSKLLEESIAEIVKLGGQ